MFESITTELLIGCGSLGVSALVIAGGISMMRAPKSGRKAVDLDAVVRDAPYHRLRDVLPADSRTCLACCAPCVILWNEYFS